MQSTVSDEMHYVQKNAIWDSATEKESSIKKKI